MYSIFVLGAGFSKPAGLPLGNELFEEILKLASQYGVDYEIHKDLKYFMEYKGIDKKSEINLEEFISYLDIEHYLRLRGSETWSCEGNKSQIVIKNLIAQILYEKISLMDEKKYKLYEDFVDKLDPTDVIITFNYDNIIENCLERKGKPYRLFLDRLESYKNGTGIIDEYNNEIVLLKMHGSIDWFDIKCHNEMCKAFKDAGNPRVPYHSVFNNIDNIKPRKIIGGPYDLDNVLNRIYKIDDLGKYFGNDKCSVTECPLILSPSSYKTLYMDSLKELWRSFNSAGLLNKKVVVIGFSLPEHDEYIRQPLFNLITQFQEFDAQPILDKSKLKMIDYRQTNESKEEYKNTYSFVDWDKTDYYFDGFNKKALNMIFNDDH